MATCKDCIHEKVCYALIKDGLPYLDNDAHPADAFCMEFKSKLDFAEIVHCKDCKYSRPLCNPELPIEGGDGVRCVMFSTSRYSVVMNKDGYCNYAERKEGLK